MPRAVLVQERVGPVLAVPERLTARDLDDRCPGLACLRCVVEEDIDFFETAAAGLRVQKVDDRNSDCVAGLLVEIPMICDNNLQDCKDDVCPPSNVAERDRRDEHDYEVR